MIDLACETPWRSLVEHAPDGILLTTVDGGILAANPAACALLGRNEQEIRAAGRAGLVVANEAVERLIEERRRTGRAHGVVTLRRKDGSTFLADAASTVFTGPAGETWTSMTFRDVTEDQRAREALAILADAGRVLASSLDLRATLNQLTDLVVPKLADVCTVDLLQPEGVARVAIAHRDPARVAAFEQVRRRTLREDASAGVDYVLRTGNPSCVFDLDDEWLRTATQDAAHFEAARALGIRSFVSVPLRARSSTVGALTLMSDGGVPSFTPADLALVRALGERAAVAIDNARLYDEARRASQARDDLLAAVSHDLGSSIGTVLATAALLSRNHLSDEKRLTLIEVLRRSASFMERLTDDLLDTARIEAGHFVLEKKRCGVRPLLADVQDLMQPLAREAGLTLGVHLPAEHLEVWCDRQRLLRVFSNLIGNAIKFTPKDGSIAVSAAAEGAHVQFAVADTGMGISPDDLPHVFDRFWQATRMAQAGAGLGLAIAREIVEAHGGRIWAEAEPGRGSTFHFTLPVHDPAQASA